QRLRAGRDRHAARAGRGRGEARVRRFAIGGAQVGGPALLIVAGPCVVESAEMCLAVAAKLKELTAARGLPFVFKASYRKANRSSGQGFSGLPGTQGLDA